MNDNVEKALKELTRIENNIRYLLSDYDVGKEVDDNFNSILEHKSCETIRQALLKSQDLEKFTRLVIKKRVDMDLLAIRYDVETYNGDYYDSHYSYDVGACLLFKEEFTFLKEMENKVWKIR